MPIKRSTDSLLSETKGLLRRYGLHARKGLAQHFLIDPTVLVNIVAAAHISPDDVVLEVGPGLGVLTKELSARAGQVIAVELDPDMIEHLKETLVKPQNLTIIQADIMQLDFVKLLRDRGVTRYKVVANLPYYITSAVLRLFLEAGLPPASLVIMVQKEIAEAITARPGDMSLLAVSVQFYGAPEIVCVVPGASFYPAPRVDSAVLKISVYPHPALAVGDTAAFFNFVRAGFRSARKQIPNSFVQGLGITRADIIPLLAKAGIAVTRRSESLSLAEWGQLWQVYRESDVYHHRPG